MSDRRKEVLNGIMEYPFDMEQYIEERLRDIDQLDERRFAKEVLLRGFGKAIDKLEQQYKELERRVYEEIEVEDNRYEVAMTVVERKHYDPTNDTLFPVCFTDVDQNGPQDGKGSSGVYVGTIFLQMNQEMIRRFCNAAPFYGTVKVPGEDKGAYFQIREAKRYRDTVEGLYQIYQDNHIPWVTVNTAYLNKFYDVFLKMDENIDTISMADCNIWFGEYADFIKYDAIPLWNIELLLYKSTNFVVPCVDGVFYEHSFSLEDKNSQDGYVIESNEDILEIRHEVGKIVIKSEKETFENWKAFRLCQKETEISLDYQYPILTNRKKDSFVRRYSESRRVQLMTKTDLFRRIMELDIGDFIEVTGYKICDNPREYPVVEGMNWFVRDELFPMESRKVLLLEFRERQPGHYLNDSMVRFVVSQMQMEINEYRCVGVLV